MRRQSNAFWRYSLKTYAVPDVADACLTLQDRAGADVNLLLLCCWQGSLGHALSRSVLCQAMAAVADWRRQVVLPLRQARRFVKSGNHALPSHLEDCLRHDIAALELDAEYLEQLLLVRCLADKSFPARKSATEAVIAGNLRRYLEILSIPLEPSLQTCLEVLQAVAR